MGNFKKIPIILVLFVVMAALVFAGGPRGKIIVKKDSTGKLSPLKPYAEGEVLVKFKKGVSFNSVNQIAAQNAMTVKTHFTVLSKLRGNEYVLLKSSKNTLDMVKELKGNGRVEAVSPNYRREIDTTPNDPRYSELWGMNNTGQTGGTADADIDAPEAWSINTGSSGVIVADIDSGLDYTHPDLAANAWVNAAEFAGTPEVDDDGNGYVDDIYGIDPANSDSDPMDDNGHGTHTAGTIGAVGNNSLGVVGVNWNVKVMGLKFLDSSGSGYDSDAILCIEYAIDQKINYGQNIVAINASWGGAGFDQDLKDAIDAAGTAGIIFCAAAGNAGSDNDMSPHYPSSYESASIIAVAATDDNDVIADFSCYGATSVDLGAPGAGILSTVPAKYVPQSGDIFFDNMENGVGNWVHGGTLDTWALTTIEDPILVNPSFPVPSPPTFWSDSPGVNYSSNTNSWLAYGADIDLTGYVGQDIYLGIGSAMYFENGYDSGIVEFSNDSGATWTAIYDFTYDAYYWSSWSWKIDDSFKTAHFRMRFHLISDYIVNYAGWMIDNVGIGAANTYYEAWDGTSMATPHVSGAVALMASQFPSESVAIRIRRILSSVDENTSLEGKCVTEGRLNLFKAISYIAPTMDFIGTWDGQGVYYRNSLTGLFVKLATPATLITAGDLDGDGIDDLIGIWPGQGGVWVKYSTTSAWAKLSSTARDIATGDMNGDGRKELLATWDGQGVYYRNSVSGAWIKLATPAEQVTSGDLDGDGIDDLIGIWRQNGVWVKYSKTGLWDMLSSTANDIATGDMNGDHRVDLVATWDGQGVYYKDSISNAWVQMATPATMVATGDLDGDNTADLVGVWPGQGGAWVKYSQSGSWAKLSLTPRHIATGWMHSGTGSAVLLAAPVSGIADGPGNSGYQDLSVSSPGESQFQCQEETNLTPQQSVESERQRMPGPGEYGFKCLEQKDLVPGSKIKK